MINLPGIGQSPSFGGGGFQPSMPIGGGTGGFGGGGFGGGPSIDFGGFIDRVLDSGIGSAVDFLTSQGIPEDVARTAANLAASEGQEAASSFLEEQGISTPFSEGGSGGASYQEPHGRQVGTVHNGPPGAPDHNQTMPLRLGLHNYDDLSSAGLHDAISHAEISDSVRVTFYADVEGGQPRGREMRVQGPTTVTIDQFRSNGLENEVSAILVEDSQGDGSTTPGDGGTGPGSTPGNGGGSGGSGGSGAQQTTLLIGLAIIGLVIWNAQ